MAATIAQASQFPSIKLVSPDTMIGMSAPQKIAAINKAFSDSYKSPLSVIVVDSIERLLGKGDFKQVSPGTGLTTFSRVGAHRPEFLECGSPNPSRSFGSSTT